MSELALISDLVAATARAHTPRALVSAIGRAFAKHVPITRVEFAGQIWSSSVGGARRELVPGFVIGTRGEMPAFGRDFCDALVNVLRAAERHVAVVQRVAALSRRALADNRVLRGDRPPALVAESPAMRAVVERAALVARHPTTVLITGESGTGKEVLAREIHRLSPRGHRPLVAINCAAIPEALVESELFGHERGAFTGAHRAHAGVFERAHRSTLLLDEIGELPAGAQAKLLRVIQERTVRRIGGERELAVDVRVIAATNRPLDGLRADLRYRLDVFSIAVPPLRERHGDLAPLADVLLRELAVDPPDASRWLPQLAAYDWPGNVRELANVLEAALILGDFPALPRRPAALAPLDAALRSTIEAALRATRGKIYGTAGAARRLGLPPGTLQSKMKKLGIARARFV